MLRKLHKLREEFPFELSSSDPDTRHVLFERRRRQLEAELSDSPSKILKGESRSLGRLCLTGLLRPLPRMQYQVLPVFYTRECPALGYLGQGNLGPVIRTATPSDNTAHSVRPYRS